MLGAVLALYPYLAQAQQVIQIPVCGNNLPSNINPAAPTIAVNPSGEVCIAGAFSATVPTPTVSVPSPLSVVIYSGNDVTEGTTADSMALSPSTVNYTVISLLKGILGNVLSPINVTGSFSTTVSSPLGVNIASSPVNVTGNLSVTPASPQNVNLDQINGQIIASPSTYGVAPVGSVQGVNSFVTNNVSVTPPSPLNVTMGTPLNVVVANAPTVIPTGTLAVNVVNTPTTFTIPNTSPQNVTVANASPTNINVAQWQGTSVASPSTYGVAPVGSVGAVNAFVTNNVNVTTPTPLQVTLPASPISVGLAGPTPLNVTIATSPVAITGSITANSASPTNVNLDQVNGQLIASPQTYGVANVGSVMGVNAFVTNNVNVTTPTPLQVTLPASPISVGLAGPTPLNVTIATSPVAITGSITANSASPTNVNLDQVNGQLIASPSTYGIAPVGSALGVNAFVTNNVSVTTPTPLQVTLPASPISVGIAGPTPLNVSLVAIPGSPISTILTQSTVTLAGSPVSVGIAGPTPLTVTLNASPLSVGIAGPTPLNVSLVAIPGSPQAMTITTPAYVTQSLVPSTVGIIAWTATPVNNVTGTVVQIQASPISLGVHQLGKIVCDGQSASWSFLQIFDAASTGAVTLGKTVPKEYVPLAPGSINGFVNPLPGDGFTQGIFLAATTTPGGSTGVGTFINCSVSYN